MSSFKINTIRQARQGWDITMEMESDGQTGGLTFYWPHKEQPKLGDKALVDKANYLFGNFVHSLAQAQVKDAFTRDEIEEVLKEKGYLKAEEKFEDLAPKEVTSG